MYPKELYMKSDICTLSQDTASLEAILNEVEKAASYNNLDKKQSLRLRLLAEELVGMVPALLEFGSGEFWVESEEKNFSLHTRIMPNTSMTVEKREKVLAVSTSGKNAAAVGVMNKIRLAAEFMMIDYAQVAPSISPEFEFYAMGATTAPVLPISAWSLSEYKAKTEQRKGGAWDELEKSIIANIADDVVVGVQGKQVEIIVKKQM